MITLLRADQTSRTRTFKQWALAGVAAAVLAQAGAAAQAFEADAAPVEFEIAAQDLGTALNAFAMQSGQEILFLEADVRGKRSVAIAGTLTPNAALTQMLSQAGFEYRVNELGTVLVGAVARDAAVRGAAQPVQNTQPRDEEEGGDEPTQTRGEDDGAREEAAIRRDSITVTGTRIRGAEGASPVITISRAELDRSGFATAEDVVEFLPQNFGAGASYDAVNGINRAEVGSDVAPFGGGASVNLRGLGTNSTLVLVNGRRLSPSGNRATFINISSIPLTAVDRVEILTDGASAIYGSDAIAGVINFIMRTDYEGAETRLRYATDPNGDTSDLQIGQAFGTAWGNGNLLLSYEYFERRPLAAADRAYTASNDLSPFGGTDNRILGGSPANIVAGNQTFAIPSGQNGRSLTAADFVPGANLNFYNANEFADIIGESKQHSMAAFLNQNAGAWNLFGQARYSIQENLTRVPSLFDVLSIPVSASSPFFVDPTNSGLTDVVVENYSIAHDFGPRTSEGELETWGLTAGARLDIGDNWAFEFVANWSREEGHSLSGNEVDTAAIIAAVNNPDPSLAFNPFGDGSNTNPGVLDSIPIGATSFGRTANELYSFSLNLDGDLFDAPGGPIALAAGVDYRNEALFFDAETQGFVTDLDRSISSAYAEVFVPIVGELNARPGLERLELSFAARFEEYDDFGSTTNPKLGVLWSPFDDLILRGTYGTSFRAPSLDDRDVNPAKIGNNTRYFPFGATPFLWLAGANEELEPEEATTWTAGFQWRPDWVPGFSIDATYFDIDFSNRIDEPALSPFTALNNPALASLVILNPTLDQVAAIADDDRYDPNFSRWPFNVPRADLISGVAPVGAIVSTQRVNSADLLVDGVQLEISYDVDTQVGEFTFDLNGDYLSNYQRRIISTDPLVQELATFGRPVEYRVRAGANWSSGAWSASGFINYTDGYTNNSQPVDSEVASWTTFDLTIAYRFADRTDLLSGTRLALTAQNLFDRNPPFVDTPGGVGFDATNANPLGRYLAFQVTKEW